MISDAGLGLTQLVLFLFFILLGFPIAFTLMAMGLFFGYLGMGERAKIIAEAAHRAGLSSRRITWVADIPEAIELLQAELKEGDVVLVKGSHGLRMDRIVSALEIVS